MSQHHDNGSHTVGFRTAISMFICLCIGYFIRDSGVTFHIRETKSVAPINRNLPGY